MKLVSNRALTHDLDEAAAVTVSRKLWGNDNVRGTQGTGENEWYTPADIIADARRVLGIIDLCDGDRRDEDQRLSARHAPHRAPPFVYRVG